jgi:hypothetical protein
MLWIVCQCRAAPSASQNLHDQLLVRSIPDWCGLAADRTAQILRCERSLTTAAWKYYGIHGHYCWETNRRTIPAMITRATTTAIETLTAEMGTFPPTRPD